MNGSEIIDEFTLSVGVKIVRWNETDRYEWWATNGDESDTLFESLEEAKEDARSRFAG